MTSPGTEGVTKQQSSKQHYYSPHKRQNFHHPSEVFLVSVCQKTTKQKKHTMKNCKKKMHVLVKPFAMLQKRWGEDKEQFEAVNALRYLQRNHVN